MSTYQHGQEAAIISAGLNLANEALHSGKFWKDSYDFVEASGGVTRIVFSADGGAQNQDNAQHGATNIRGFTEYQQQMLSSALQEYEHIANLKFTEAAPGADAAIKFFTATLPVGYAGWAWQPGAYGADVVISEKYESAMNTGSYGYRLLLHETAHALGLEHPYDDGKHADFSTDTTLMSYNDGMYSGRGGTYVPVGPQLYDIAALQALYGANHGYRAGNDDYRFDGGALVKTVWDGDGSDTYRVGSFTGNATLDLREGPDFISFIGQSRVWTAFGANIEHAAGGTGNDTLLGNRLSNRLEGGIGSDTLLGGESADTLLGGEGLDTYALYLGDGHDVLMDAGTNGLWLENQLLEGEVSGGSLSFGALTLRFDWLGKDVRISVAGNGEDSWTLQGYQAGDYNLFVHEPAPTQPVEPAVITTGTVELPQPVEPAVITPAVTPLFNDITGTAKADKLKGAGADDRITGDAGNDTLRGNGGNDLLDGGLGADVVYGGAGDDIFVIGLEQGKVRDTVKDFRAGEDKIDLGAFGFSDFSDLRFTNKGSYTLLDLGGGQELRLIGVTPGQMYAEDFILS